MKFSSHFIFLNLQRFTPLFYWPLEVSKNKPSNRTINIKQRNIMKTNSLCVDQIITMPSNFLNRKIEMYFYIALSWLGETLRAFSSGYYHISGYKIFNELFIINHSFLTLDRRLQMGSEEGQENHSSPYHLPDSSLSHLPDSSLLPHLPSLTPSPLRIAVLEVYDALQNNSLSVTKSIF